MLLRYLAELLRDGFGEKPWFKSLIAEVLHCSEENNLLPKKKAVGFALFFDIYSTWEGRSLFLQDLYIEPAYRGTVLTTEPIFICIVLFRKIPYPSHGRLFGLNPPTPLEIPVKPHTFLSTFWLLRPPTPLEFPMTFRGVGMDIFWNCT